MARRLIGVVSSLSRKPLSISAIMPTPDWPEPKRIDWRMTVGMKNWR
jgi:hypothetical protein